MVAITKPRKVSERVFAGDSIFAGTNTVDPYLVEEAWERLSVNTWPYQLEALPEILKNALFQTAESRLADADTRKNIIAKMTSEALSSE